MVSSQDGGFGTLEVTHNETNNNSFSLFYINKSYYQMYLTVEVTLKNAVPLSFGNNVTIESSSETAWTISSVVPGNRNDFLISFVGKPGQAWNFEYKYRYKCGNPNAKPVYDYKYLLPLASKDGNLTVNCCQSFFGSFSHSGAFKYAVDFSVTEGTPIVAAREGVVVQVKSHFTNSGSDSSFKDLANLIAVQHEDGTVASYVHLKPNGTVVKNGDKVSKGALLGYSGNTGWSVTPHLHFHVGVLNTTSGEQESIPFVFENGTPQGFVPAEGASVKITNKV